MTIKSIAAILFLMFFSNKSFADGGFVFCIYKPKDYSEDINFQSRNCIHLRSGETRCSAWNSSSLTSRSLTHRHTYDASEMAADLDIKTSIAYWELKFDYSFAPGTQEKKYTFQTNFVENAVSDFSSCRSNDTSFHFGKISGGLDLYKGCENNVCDSDFKYIGSKNFGNGSFAFRHSEEWSAMTVGNEGIGTVAWGKTSQAATESALASCQKNSDTCANPPAVTNDLEESFVVTCCKFPREACTVTNSRDIDAARMSGLQKMKDASFKNCRNTKSVSAATAAQ